jgi:hypothetical protein
MTCACIVSGIDLGKRHFFKYAPCGRASQNSRIPGPVAVVYPPEWRWRPNERLAQTIVPWTALWLYYYEGWLVTGDWLGPSSHREIGSKERAA